MHHLFRLIELFVARFLHGIPAPDGYKIYSVRALAPLARLVYTERSRKKSRGEGRAEGEKISKDGLGDVIVSFRMKALTGGNEK